MHQWNQWLRVELILDNCSTSKKSKRSQRSSRRRHWLSFLNRQCKNHMMPYPQNTKTSILVQDSHQKSALTWSPICAQWTVWNVKCSRWVAERDSLQDTWKLKDSIMLAASIVVITFCRSPRVKISIFTSSVWSLAKQIMRLIPNIKNNTTLL